MEPSVLHGVPSSALVGAGQPSGGVQVPGTRHTVGVVHTTAEPGTQAPLWHLSVAVQTLPSLQGSPSGFEGYVHVPVLGSQVAPASNWHSVGVVQVTDVPPPQTPAWQLSPVVQRLPSVQVVPSGLLGFEHSPVAGLHVPTSWH